MEEIGTEGELPCSLLFSPARFYSASFAAFEAHHFQVASLVDLHFRWTPSASKGAQMSKPQLVSPDRWALKGRHLWDILLVCGTKGLERSALDFNSLFL